MLALLFQHDGQNTAGCQKAQALTPPVLKEHWLAFLHQETVLLKNFQSHSMVFSIESDSLMWPTKSVIPASSLTMNNQTIAMKEWVSQPRVLCNQNNLEKEKNSSFTLQTKKNLEKQELSLSRGKGTRVSILYLLNLCRLCLPLLGLGTLRPHPFFFFFF